MFTFKIIKHYTLPNTLLIFLQFNAFYFYLIYLIPAYFIKI